MPATSPEAIARKKARNAARTKGYMRAVRESGATEVCEACVMIGRVGERGSLLHSCENFPMPHWARLYTDTFDLYIRGEGDAQTMRHEMSDLVPTL